MKHFVSCDNSCSGPRAENWKLNERKQEKSNFPWSDVWRIKLFVFRSFFRLKIVSISRRKQFACFVAEWSHFSYQLLLDWQKKERKKQLTIRKDVFCRPCWYSLRERMRWTNVVDETHFNLNISISTWFSWTYLGTSIRQEGGRSVTYRAPTENALHKSLSENKRIVIISTNNNAKKAEAWSLKLKPTSKRQRVNTKDKETRWL